MTSPFPVYFTCVRRVNHAECPSAVEEGWRRCKPAWHEVNRRPRKNENQFQPKGYGRCSQRLAVFAGQKQEQYEEGRG
ncbi:hypothetical protein RSOLAG1IB_00517 [Rhizoctonia solani AG-1 IB]|uniref:Uncharacterized protein n=1 Tax=Thanatephorus cucumeris (strain AG1-IB / isolate 7/3/14) TaxID=1108050 RepID=A0A0B7F373_THACB|nr:hypothetical protein RSOLAG1IB_00517 [Rhizoctonia solani AG-1 IB]